MFSVTLYDEVILLLLDFIAAFDTTYHNLISHVEHCVGIGVTAIVISVCLSIYLRRTPPPTLLSSQKFNSWNRPLRIASSPLRFVVVAELFNCLSNCSGSRAHLKILQVHFFLRIHVGGIKKIVELSPPLPTISPVEVSSSPFRVDKELLSAPGLLHILLEALQGSLKVSGLVVECLP